MLFIQSEKSTFFWRACVLDFMNEFFLMMIWKKKYKNWASKGIFFFLFDNLIIKLQLSINYHKLHLIFPTQQKKKKNVCSPRQHKSLLGKKLVSKRWNDYRETIHPCKNWMLWLNFVWHERFDLPELYL